MPCPLTGPRGLGILFVNCLSERILARSNVLGSCPITNLELWIVAFPPSDIVRKSIELRNRIVKFDKLESRPFRLHHRGWVIVKLPD